MTDQLFFTGYLLEECVLSLASHIIEKKQQCILNQVVSKKWTCRVLFLKAQQGCFGVVDLVLTAVCLMAVINVVTKLECSCGSAVIFLVLSESNWGQLRQRKSLCRWQRLHLVDQWLTFCLMNYRNPKGNVSNMHNLSIGKMSLPLSTPGEPFDLHNLYFTGNKRSHDVLCFCPEEPLKYSIGHKFFHIVQ